MHARWLIIAVVLISLAAGASAKISKVKQGELVVTWYPIQEGITHFAYNISVENPRPGKRSIDLSMVISGTNFPIDKLRNVVFYELEEESYTVSIPVYEEESYECPVFNNATQSNETTTCTRIVQTHVREETRHKVSKKPLALAVDVGPRKHRGRAGFVVLPQAGRPGENVKWYRLEFDAPIVKTPTGWGSSGRVALEIDGVEYHSEWNQSYVFRRPIIINNNAGSPLPAGYTVNITLDHASLVAAGKSLASGDDLRVVFNNGSGDIELDRINITAFNAADTVILFRTQAEIPASSGSDTDYYLYYGNPSPGSPPADPSNVYLLWDDFTGPNGVLPDPAKWLYQAGEGGYTHIQNNQLRTYSIRGSDSEVSWILSQLNLAEGFAYKIWLKSYSAFINTYWSVLLRNATADVDNWMTGDGLGAIRARDGTGPAEANFRVHKDGAEVLNVAGVGSNIPIEIRYLDNYVWVYADNVLKWEGQWTLPEAGVKVSVGARGGGTFGEYSDARWDDASIRRYLSPEPSTTLGSEEKRSGMEDYYTESILVPSGASKLVSTVTWTGFHESSNVTLTLIDPLNNQYEEFSSNVTTRRKVTKTVIPFPALAYYNITRYDGVTRLMVYSPLEGTWTLIVADTNVTGFEVDVEISQ